MAKPYAKYDFFPNISYNIISNLIDNPDAEIIWKLLKYTNNDAWEADDLTKEEKRELIYQGEADGSKYAVFFDSGMDESITEGRIYLRIYPYYCIPDSPYSGIVDVAFEIICHNNINTLSNYTTRVDSVIAALIRCLNGEDIGGVGVMFFDTGKKSGGSGGSRTDKIQNFNQYPYKGKILLMSTIV